MFCNITKSTLFRSLLAISLLMILFDGSANAAPKRKKQKESVPLFPNSRKEPTPESHSVPIATTDTQKGQPPQNYVRGLFGLVSGLGHVSSAVFIFGGDYVRALRPNIDVTAGISRWSNVYSDSTYSIDMAVTTIDAGGEYKFSLLENIAFKGSGRLGLSLSSAATQDVEIGLPISDSRTVTALEATFGGSLVYTTGKLQIGAELRKPFFFAKLQDEGTHVYLMATGTYAL